MKKILSTPSIRFLLIFVLIAALSLACNLTGNSDYGDFTDDSDTAQSYEDQDEPADETDISPTLALQSDQDSQGLCPNGDCAPACLAALSTMDSDQTGRPQSDIDPDFTTSEAILLASYRIEGNKIIPETVETSRIANWLEPFRDDTAYHQFLWKLFSSLVPESDRKYLTQFNIMTDGVDETLASVAQSESDMNAWQVEIDVLDTADLNNLVYTLVHELSHLTALSREQVDLSQEIFDNPDDQDIYEQEAESCPFYFPGEGCSKPNSYINAFYQRFWAENPNLAEWQEIDAIEDEDSRLDALDGFYQQYSDQFVSDYAPTNPDEDLAESFTNFVLSPKPTGDTLKAQKVRFFYEYPELVEMRAAMASAICGLAGQP